MFGSIALRMTPPMIVKTPMTAISCVCDHPPRSSVWSKISASTASPVPSASSDWKSWITKLARYCRSFITLTRRNSNASRPPASGVGALIRRPPRSAAR